MRSLNHFLRPFFFLFLLACLLTSLVGNVKTPVSAASSGLVISQVYGGGGNSGAPYNADYVELFNLGPTTVPLSGWSIQYAPATSTSWIATNLNGSIAPGQYFLVQLGSPVSSGSPLPTPDVSNLGPSPDPTISATAGKIALVNTTTVLSGNGCPFSANVIDFVGYGTTADCREGGATTSSNAPSPSNTTADIRVDSCFDTDNNNVDFSAGAPNPRNSSVASISCLKVNNVTSTATDFPAYTYGPGETIYITVTFNNNVNVDISGGTPSLLLETGHTDAEADYISGSGGSTLTFSYLVGSNDSSVDLDYVSKDSLVLNGGTITGAIGDAVLTLPDPKTTGSLGANKTIAVDNNLLPSVTVNQEASQVDPSGSFPIKFTVVFSEPVASFTGANVTQNGTATGVTWSVVDSGDHMTFTLSATSAATTGTITPSIAVNQVADLFGDFNTASTSTDNVVTYEIAPFNATIALAGTQPASTGETPINFTITFGKAINPSTFSLSDIIQNGTATGITWNLSNADAGVNKVFNLSALAITSTGTKTVNPIIAVNTVFDLAGNGNNASNTNAIVTFNNDTAPFIKSIDHIGQPDPTNAFPIKFNVKFSEAIIASIFTPSDITQGTVTSPATGVTWSVADTGDHTNFIVSATSATGSGNIFPYIAANRVTDLVGNNNVPSSSTSTPDNTVMYDAVRPTLTITQAGGQADPTSVVPINFTVVFSEKINPATFIASDITQSGTATGITWSVADSGDQTTFNLSATFVAGGGILKPTLAIDKVADVAGNGNSASSNVGTNDEVTFIDTVPPTITITQATSQTDPASSLPVLFDVKFSEAINASSFTTADVTQGTGATATGVVWNIANPSGDKINFTLSATAVTGSGTIIPFVAANKVTDLAGNNNSASTNGGGDGMVTYTPAPPPGFHNVIINEIAWSGTKAVGGENDEWIELYNTTSNPIDLDGWTLKSDDTTPNISLTGYTIAGNGYLLLARKTGTFNDVTTVPILVYGDTGTTHTLTNTGEILRLKNASGADIDIANSYSGYGFTKWAAGSVSPNYASMERKSYSISTPAEWFTFASTSATYLFAHDRDNNIIHGTPGRANWALSVTATPSPQPTATKKATPTRTAVAVVAPPPALIAINEFVPRPGHDWNSDGFINTGDEYIELINHGTISVNLSGYRLDDEANIGSSPFTLPSVTLLPGERIVFYGSKTGLLLSDGGDGVRLLKPNGQLMDAYNYFTVNFPDQSFCRLPDNGGADDWNVNCYPTPGLRNSLSGSLLRPPTEDEVAQPLCPISDILPQEFVIAECSPFGHNIWNRYYWDKHGWLGEMKLPNVDGKWEVFGE